MGRRPTTYWAATAEMWREEGDLADGYRCVIQTDKTVVRRINASNGIWCESLTMTNLHDLHEAEQDGVIAAVADEAELYAIIQPLEGEDFGKETRRARAYSKTRARLP